MHCRLKCRSNALKILAFGSFSASVCRITVKSADESRITMTGVKLNARSLVAYIAGYLIPAALRHFETTDKGGRGQSSESGEAARRGGKSAPIDW
jgi:hypothetical protein